MRYVIPQKLPLLLKNELKAKHDIEYLKAMKEKMTDKGVVAKITRQIQGLQKYRNELIAEILKRFKQNNMDTVEFASLVLETGTTRNIALDLEKRWRPEVLRLEAGGALTGP